MAILDMEKVKVLHQLGFYIGYTMTLDTSTKVAIAIDKVAMLKGITKPTTPEGERHFVKTAGKLVQEFVNSCSFREKDIFLFSVDEGKAAVAQLKCDFEKEHGPI